MTCAPAMISDACLKSCAADQATIADIANTVMIIPKRNLSRNLVPTMIPKTKRMIAAYSMIFHQLGCSFDRQSECGATCFFSACSDYLGSSRAASCLIEIHSNVGYQPNQALVGHLCSRSASFKMLRRIFCTATRIDSRDQRCFISARYT